MQRNNLSDSVEQRMLTYIDAHEAQMLDLWKEIVRLESPSHDKRRVDAVGNRLAQFCTERLGYAVRFQEDAVYGNCLCACSCPFDEYQHGVALSAHMDTVHEVGFFDPVIQEDAEYLYGPGAGDCKGGIIMCLLIAMTLKEIGYNKRPIKLLFAADEESGGPTGAAFYPAELVGSDYMFNAESGKRNEIVTGRKSSIIAIYDIVGEAGHVGYLQEKPKSAIREAAMKILALENESDYQKRTFVCGVIKGGTVATSVPDNCQIQVNVRITDDRETTYVPGTSCTMSIRGNCIPMRECEENKLLCRRFSDASQSLGYGAYKSVFVGGASDASYAAQMGIPVICASGPVVDYQHTKNERVLKSSMAERAKIHVKTILDL